MTGINSIRGLFLCVFILLVNLVQAKNEHNLSIAISTPFTNGNNVQVLDSKYSNISSNGFVGFFDKKIEGLIRLKIDPTTLKNQTGLFSKTVSINVEYDLYNASSPTNFTAHSQTITLSVSYNPNGVTKGEALYRIPNAYRVKATVNGNVSNPSGLQLKLSAEINTTRYYDFTRDYFNSSNIYSNINTNDNTIFQEPFIIDAANRLIVKWDPVDGAEEYDLEWVHINNHPETGTTKLPKIDVKINTSIFKERATRISTKQEEYSVPMLFDEGYLLFRVRAKGKIAGDGYNKLYESNWSTDKLTFTNVDEFSNGKFTVGASQAHETNKNWNYQAVFTENGNNKYSVSYADGSSRVRQAVVNQNDKDESVVMETFYDFQGRPAIQSLPAPTGDPTLKFYPEFNMYNSTEPYSKAFFDKDISGCENATEAFKSDLSGPSAGKYYSPNNPDASLSENMYVPDAGGYPFTQTLYTPDKTGRVRSKTIPGESFKVGSQKETTFMYAMPYQEELNLLFGSDAGYAHKYKKNVTVDANGQSSINFIDPNNKTIATVLTGASPTNLSELEAGSPPASYRVDLLSKARKNDAVGMLERLDFAAGIRELSRVIPITEASSPKFYYENKGAQFDNSCYDDLGILIKSFCYDCVFDLEVSLKDNCDVEYLSGIGGAGKTTVKIGEGLPDSSICGTIDSEAVFQEMELTVNTSSLPALNLTPGTYNLRKVLKINHEKLDAYTVNFLAHNECLKTKEDFKNEELVKLQLSTDCEYSCDSCLSKLGGDYETNRYNVAHNAQCDPCFTEFEFNLLIEGCLENCISDDSKECENAYQTMLADMSPGGQYGLISEGGNIGSDGVISPIIGEVIPQKFPLSIFNDNNVLPRREIEEEVVSTSGSIELVVPSWRKPIEINAQGKRIVGATPTLYPDRTGEPYRVYLTKNDDDSYSPPQQEGEVVQYDGDKQSYFIYPHQLRNVKDFLDVWDPSWAKLLVPYHPEYGYYQYCVIMQASNNFDQHLRNLTEMDDLDPAYRTAFDGSHINANFFFNIDPFFKKAGSDANPYPSVEVDLLRIAMKYRLQNYTNKHSVWQLAFAQENCIDMNCTDCQIPQNSEPSLQINDASLHAFRTLYLSLKAELMALHRHLKVITQPVPISNPDVYIFPSYNDCIGNENFNKHKYGFFNFDATFKTSNIWAWQILFASYQYNNGRISQYFYYSQPCNFGTFELYSHKDRRFDNGASRMGSDALVNEVSGQIDLSDFGNYANDTSSAKNNRVFDDLQKKHQVQRYLQCGQCPVAYDLQVLLNGIITNEIFSLTSSNIPLDKCNIPELTNELNSLFQSNGEQKDLDPASDLEWIGTGGNNAEIFASIGDCNIHLESLSGYGISYDEVTNICCIQAGNNPGEFFFTIYYDDPAKPGREVDTIVGGTIECLDFVNCDFGDKCVVGKQGYMLQDLLNNLVTVQTCGSFPCSQTDFVRGNVELNSSVYRSVNDPELEGYLIGRSTYPAVSPSPFLYDGVAQTATTFEASIGGCPLYLQQAIGDPNPHIDWDNINYFYDIQPDESTISDNQYFIKASTNNGETYHLIGNSCLMARECTPYLDEPLLQSNNVVDNKDCKETELFFELKNYLESYTYFANFSGVQQEILYGGILPNSETPCKILITLMDNPFSGGLISQPAKNLSNVINIKGCYIKSGQNDNKQFFATVEFNDHTYGEISINYNCGDVMTCANKTMKNTQSKGCEYGNDLSFIENKFESYINLEKNNLTLIPDNAGNGGKYLLDNYMPDCQVYLYQGLYYNPKFTYAHSGTTGLPLSSQYLDYAFVDVVDIKSLRNFYVVENPNALGELKIAYAVCELNNGDVVQFKLELVGKCSFGNCAGCINPNLLYNGDFEEITTVDELYLDMNPNKTSSLPEYFSYLPYAFPSNSASINFSLGTYQNYFYQMALTKGAINAFYYGPDGNFENYYHCVPSNLGLHSIISEESSLDMKGNFLLIQSNTFVSTPSQNILIWEQEVNVEPNQSYLIELDAFIHSAGVVGCKQSFDVKIVTPANTTVHKIEKINDLMYSYMGSQKYLVSCANNPGLDIWLAKKEEGYPLDWSNIKIPFNSSSNSLITIQIEISTGVNDPNYVPSGHPNNCSDVFYYGFDNISVRKRCIPQPSEFCRPLTQQQDPFEVVIPSCEDEMEATAEYAANVLYKRYVDSVSQDFKERYIEKCLNTYEDLTMDHIEGEQQYTLYYYDQAGNLVRTIPPKGVKKLSPDDFDKIDEDRYYGNKTIFTEHEMATTYAYNSLGQLLQQSVPDHDDLDIFKTKFIENADSKIPTDFTVTDISFSSTQSGVMVGYRGLLSANKGEIYVTNNAGKSWQKANNTGLSDYEFISSEKHIVGEDGLLLYFTGGDWIKRKSPTNERLIYSMTTYEQDEIIIFSESGNSWYGSDYGQAWSSKNNNLASKLNGKITSYEIDLASGKGVAVSNQGEVFYTYNLGDTWSKGSMVKAGDLTTISKIDGKYVIAGKGGTVLENNNGNGLTDKSSGLTGEIIKLFANTALDWIAIYKDPSTGNSRVATTATAGVSWSTSGINDVVDFYFTNANNGYLLTESDVYTTTNKGKTWSAPVGATNGNLDYSSVYSVGTNYFIGKTNGVILYNVPGFNGTLTVSSGLNIKKFSIDMGSNSRVALLENNGIGEIYYSNNSVSNPSNWTWTLLAGGFSSDNFVDIHFPGSNKWFALTDKGKVIYTSNGGISWSTKSNLADVSAPYKSIYMASATTDGVIAGDDGLVQTTQDGGATWSNLTYNVKLQGLNDVAMDLSVSNIYAAGANGTVIKSSNSGVNWELLASKTIHKLSDIEVNSGAGLFGGDNVVGQISGGAVVAATSTSYMVEDIMKNGSTYYILHNNGLETGTYGSLSSIAMPNESFNAIIKDGIDLIAIGDNGVVYESANNGGAWTIGNEFSPPTLSSVFSLNYNKWFAGGKDGYLITSDNGGDTWTPFTNQPTTSAFITGIYFANSSVGILTLDNGSALKYDIGGTNKWPLAETTTGTLADGGGCAINDIAMLNSQYGMVLGKCNIYETTAGVNADWKNITYSNSLTSGELKSVVMVDRNRGYAAGNSGRFVEINRVNDDLVATDKGNKFAGNNIAEIYFADRVRGYAVTGEELYMTTNGGDSWSFKANIGGTNNLSINNIVFSELGVGYYAGDDGAYGTITDFSEYFSDRFYYDKLGRLVASQNAKQFNLNTANENIYSYTIYDELGRIAEVGEINTATAVTDNIVNAQLDQDLWEAWLAGGTKSQITRTYYDNPMSCSLPITQNRLRSRVASITYQEINTPNDPCIYDNATHYSYDVHGNVNTVVQEFPSLDHLEQRFKTINYEYDLISGNVLKVSYQPEQTDQFYHKYEYDSDNKIKKAFTSTNGYTWTEEAAYEYYRHGPLKRTQLGEWEVQGLDYAYTIQGWLKGVNSNSMVSSRDIGRDATASALNRQDVAKDAFGFNLGYFNGDYTPVGSPAESFEADINGSYIGSTMKDLYNGNIAYMTTAFTSNTADGSGPQAMVYSYDQLNRIKGATSYTDMGPDNVWGSTSPTGKYNTSYTYDANGNIENLNRNDDAGDLMDEFNYIYQHPDQAELGVNDLGGKKTNRLLAVQDGTSSDPGLDDLKPGQKFSSTDLDVNNYTYDAIGNLIKDEQEDIEEITWTVSGKVKTIRRAVKEDVGKPDLEFFYDGTGNRIRKLVKPRDYATGELLNEDTWVETMYVRDASGNVMSTYNKTYAPNTAVGEDVYTEKLEQSDAHIYGSDRLGVYERDGDIAHRDFTSVLKDGLFDGKEFGEIVNPPQTDALSLSKGDRKYELKNHLGNVLAVINDNKKPVFTSIETTTTLFSEDFRRDPGEWQSYGDADLEINREVLVVNVNERNAGIKRDLGINYSSSCTYRLCFEFAEPLPEGLSFVTLDESGNVLGSFEVNSTVVCFDIDGQTVFSVGFILAEPGQFGLISAELTKTCTSGIYSHYEATVLQRNDYYPFGMQMPGRSLSLGEGYRYGFNGKEKDDEVSGAGNQYDYGFRIYNPRIGKFLSVDPLTGSYPWYTPYQFAGNNPIKFIDLDGLEQAPNKGDYVPQVESFNLNEFVSNFVGSFIGSDIKKPELDGTEQVNQRKVEEFIAKKEAALIRVEDAQDVICSATEFVLELGLGIPGVDIVGDPILALYYSYEGDYVNAGMYSAASFIPGASGLANKYLAVELLEKSVKFDFLITGRVRNFVANSIDNPILKNTFTELYRPGATVGTGSTASAVINEGVDGVHYGKALERITQLKNLLGNKEKYKDVILSDTDKKIANFMLNDLKDAVKTAEAAK